MAKPQDLQKTVTRRAVLVGSVMGASGMALASRLYYLQFVKGEEFTTQAEGNRIKLQLISPPRGIITDANGVEMAGNDVNYRLFLDRENPKRARQTMEMLATLLKWDEAKKKAMFAQLSPRPRGPLMVSDRVNWDQLSRLEYFLEQLPGLTLEEGQLRTYPYAEHAAHLIGYVGRVAEGEAGADEALAKLPEFKIGKNGVEQLFEARLRGIAGTRQLEVNVNGLPVRELARKAPTPGEKLRLTIDSRLQEFTVQRLKDERSAAVVVMDVHSGDMKALVSMPGFDPNVFSKGIPPDYWRELVNDEAHPLLNKAISGLYPPGSVFKMLVGLAALRSGKIKPHEKVYCPGHFYLGNHRFNCWKPEGHGHVDCEQAIVQSCDTYFYTVGRAMGIETLAEAGHAFGIGELTGLGLKGEKAGIMPSPTWKKGAGRGPWNPGETINTSIGQGDVLVTPLQMAVMTARLVNGGKRVMPRLVAGEEAPEFEDMGFSEEHLKIVRDAMDAVVNTPRGTAYGSRITEPAYAMGGKTGTAQVRRITVRGQNQNLIPWKYRHHAWFVAYAPVVNPQYACCVLVEHGGGGSSAAAPIARDVMRRAMELHEMLPPSALWGAGI
jgi:penicillin-binding protein 2